MNETGKESDGRAGDGKSPGLVRPVSYAVAALLALAIGAWFLAGPGSAVDQKDSPATARASSGNETATSVRGPADSPPVFEIYEPDTFEGQAKLADMALIEAVNSTGLAQGGLELTDVRSREHLGAPYHFQTLSLNKTGNSSDFFSALQGSLSRLLPQAEISRPAEDEYRILIASVPTHRILIRPDLGQAAPEPVADGPKMAIVIDDLGMSVSYARDLAALPVPITFSVWPESRHDREVAQLAFEAGRDVLLHQPMEPQGYPEVDPGPGAVFITMTREEIQDIVRKNLERIPHAKGLNNHMGSRFTQWSPGVNAVLSVIRENDMFILDSRTTGKSKVMRRARDAKIPAYCRDVFIDNNRDIGTITHQLVKAQKIAEKTGSAIAIGHPHPETLQALAKWADTLNSTVSVVNLSRLSPVK